MDTKYGSYENCIAVVVLVNAYSVSNLNLHMGNKSMEDQLSFPYKNIVGSLLFAQLGTRFDILFVIAHVTKFLQDQYWCHIFQL
jgi:hypothetical protein